MKHLKTITLWNVTIEQAEKHVGLLQQELLKAIENEAYNDADNILYQIKQIKEAIARETRMEE